MINNNHANGMCYYKGKIYATSADKKITVIDFSTLAVTKTISMSHDVTWIDVYEDKFYTGTNYTIVVYDDTFTTEISRVATNYSEYVKGSVYLNGGFIYDGYIYYLIGNNAICKVTLSGEVIRVYNIGATNGDYVVGEGEFLLKYNDELILGSSQFVGAGSNQNWRVHQFFNFDLMIGYNGTNDKDRAWEGGGTYYVDNTVTTSTTADGSSSKPYPVISWAVTEYNQQRFNRPGYRGVINVVASTYDELLCIYDAHNLAIDGNDSTINGIVSIGNGEIAVAEFNIAHKNINYTSNKAIYIQNTSGTFSSITKLADDTDVQALEVVNSNVMLHIIIQDAENKGQLGQITRSIVGSRINIVNTDGNYIVCDDSVCNNYYNSPIAKKDNNGYTSNTRLWSGAMYEGTIPVDSYNGDQFTTNRYKSYTFITNDVINRSHNMRAISSNTFIITDTVIYNNKPYTRQLSFNRTTGEVHNNKIYDHSTGTLHSYASGLEDTYPFLKLVNVFGND